MKKWIAIYNIFSANGTQSFTVEAEDIETARKLFAEGKGEFLYEEIYATDIQENPAGLYEYD
jgi:hypothetical protein